VCFVLCTVVIFDDECMCYFCGQGSGIFFLGSFSSHFFLYLPSPSPIPPFLPFLFLPPFLTPFHPAFLLSSPFSLPHSCTTLTPSPPFSSEEAMPVKHQNVALDYIGKRGSAINVGRRERVQYAREILQKEVRYEGKDELGGRTRREGKERE
jgi:hypothetical protein